MPAGTAQRIADEPPVGSLFAAFLGYNPMEKLRRPADAVAAAAGARPPTSPASSSSPSSSPSPFIDGLRIAFTASIDHVPHRRVGVVDAGRALVAREDDGAERFGSTGGGRGSTVDDAPMPGGMGAGMTANPATASARSPSELGVSTRTLRYYEELGLLTPSSYSTGGSRRYVEADRQRILRIRELQAIMGFNLEEIREILHADDRLAELAREYRKGVTPKRQQRHPASRPPGSNARTQEQVLAKIAILQAFQAELEAKADRYREVAAELGIDISKETYAPKAPTLSTDHN